MRPVRIWGAALVVLGLVFLILALAGIEDEKGRRDPDLPRLPR